MDTDNGVITSLDTTRQVFYLLYNMQAETDDLLHHIKTIQGFYVRARSVCKFWRNLSDELFAPQFDLEKVFPRMPLRPNFYKYAIENDKRDAVAFLLDRCKATTRILWQAYHHQNMEILSIMCHHPKTNKLDALSFTCEYHLPLAMELITGPDFDLHMQDEEPMKIAIRNKYIDIVLYLISSPRISTKGVRMAFSYALDLAGEYVS